MTNSKKQIDDYELFTVIYKKHRYWLTVFYILAIGLFIALQGIEEESKQIVKFRKNLEFITHFHGNQTLKFYISDPSVPFPNFLKKVLKYQSPRNWEKIKTHNSKYKHRQMLIISSLTEMSEYPDSLNNALFLNKCAFVLDQMTKNDITSLLNSTDNSFRDKKWSERINKFTQAFNDSISNIFDLYLQDSLVPFFYQKYELKNIEKLNIDKIRYEYDNSGFQMYLYNYFDKDIPYLQLYIEDEIIKYEANQLKKVVKIPYTEIGISTKLVPIISMMLMIPFAFYVLILTLCFNLYSGKMHERYQNFQHYPLLTHMLEHIGFPNIPQKIRNFLNFFFPVALTLVLVWKLIPYVSYWIWGVLVLYITALGFIGYYYLRNNSLKK